MLQTKLIAKLMISMVLSCGAAYGQDLNNPNKLRPCPKNRNLMFNNCWGTFADADGNKYVGEWKNDKKNGRGTDFYSNGDKFVGEFKNDNKHRGTYTFLNGGEYDGEFMDGQPNGRGISTQVDGKRFEGIWENGSLITETKVGQTNANKDATAANCKSAGGLECMVDGMQGLESDDFNTRLNSLFQMAEGAAVFNENFCNSVYTPQQRAAAKKRNSSSSFKVNAVPENGNRVTKISYAGQSGCTDAHTFKIDYVVRSGNSASCVISCGIGAENTCGGYVRARCVP